MPFPIIDEARDLAMMSAALLFKRERVEGAYGQATVVLGTASVKNASAQLVRGIAGESDRTQAPQFVGVDEVCGTG